MASLVRSGSEAPEAYRGLDAIFEYTNQDGSLVQFNCGQAAACTFLTHHGLLKPAEDRANEVMREIEASHPPDNFGGWFGTSRRRVERICRAFNQRLTEIEGEEEFRCHLDDQRPIIVMLGVQGVKFLGRHLPAGHWMVAYGYDSRYVYLTNYGYMTWEEFRANWYKFVPWLIRMNGRGLVLESE